MLRRVGNARAAPGASATVKRKRRLTRRAPWRRQEPQIGPAGSAKLVVRARNGSTARAPGRQYRVNKRVERSGHDHAILSRGRARGTSARMGPADIFDRTLRRQRRDRAAPNYARADFLRRFMIDEIGERLASVKRHFTDALDLGCHDAAMALPAGRVIRCDAGFGFAGAAGGVQADEDRLPFADASFDLVVSAGVLDQVNDVPGALALIRRVLKPDGLFIGAFVGGASLATLREVLRAAEQTRPVARLHPQIEVRAAGDLLQRAGFALPVADTERLTLRYASLLDLAHDVRAMAAGNLLAQRQPLGRDALARAMARFAALADDDHRTREYVDIIFLTAWSPGPGQPIPARRGSGTVSLATALKSPGAGR